MVDYYSCKMSGSDDEFEPQIQTGMSKAELRRSNKPIMEKKRRQRINNCLDELKSLILEAMKKDPTRHSKLEKADILEMTVKHLQQIQRQQLSSAVATDPVVLTKFRSGFSECANEVSRYVNHLENVDPTVKQRLVSHLNNCVSNLQQPLSPFYNHYVPYMPERLYPEVKVGFQADVQGCGGGDENNNSSHGATAPGPRIQIPSNVQLIPSRLPTGELALLVPPSANITGNFPGFFPPTGSEQQSTPTGNTRIGTPSAFTAVQRTHSPLLSPSTSTTSSFEESLMAHGSESYPTCFKVPEQSPASSSSSSSSSSYSSPETQKPQISSSSDRSSPPQLLVPVEQQQPQRSEANSPPTTGLVKREPLSVITDKCNRTLGGLLPSTRREQHYHSLKRHASSEGLVLQLGEQKKPRREVVHEACTTTTIGGASTSSSFTCHSPTGVIRVKEEFPNSSSDEQVRPASLVGSSSETSATTTTNGDMWRPW
ncbi:protein deadpan-like [Copidosoma floridanum]|uniref:protein deadpan-like n=1 Tax=Copidosoma floridanum TaxID=29053 RepID=UPI0006C9C916|nr:protein deadpan-like [Copidosoma floridanum]